MLSLSSPLLLEEEVGLVCESVRVARRRAAEQQRRKAQSGEAEGPRPRGDAELYGL